MKTVSQTIFNILKGAWRFKRVISDNGIVNGVAEFKEAKPETLHYREEGEWLNADQIFRISKEYQYCYDAKADKITVYFFEQGQADKIFHEIKLVSLTDKESIAQGSGEHQCEADHYKAQYRFFNQNKFSLFYQVKGPKKDYISETIFNREESGSAAVSPS